MKIRRELGIEFVFIPEGSFLMGSPDSEKDRNKDEAPQHRVHLDGFWMGKYPVTQGQWKLITGTNPAFFRRGKNYPVESISWSKVQTFINKINSLHSGSFRLPTEAEWEYACRAGTKTPFYFGETIDSNLQANFNSEENGVFRESTTDVKIFPPNAFGLHDMHGNVWEWCQDWYDEGFYSTEEAVEKNPVCTNNASGMRVLRGGSWYYDSISARSAFRGGNYPDARSINIGVRLVYCKKGT